eukprot:scaffold6829_cov171-Amphora_coffeaeformis.AAC.3
MQSGLRVVSSWGMVDATEIMVDGKKRGTIVRQSVNRAIRGGKTLFPGPRERRTSTKRKLRLSSL